ncbi:MAG TPA: DUF2971 domain-containing protein [Paracoccus sp. (in: a-proteobacteria)]|nr:DUF2971 domain-containing protein [Paracoccus sp. (in: a-proteobacteria)]
MQRHNDDPLVRGNTLLQLNSKIHCAYQIRKGDSMTPEEVRKAVWRLCMPYAMDRIEQVRKSGTKFVHYTSAFAALQIIEKEKVWMRNALVMNDFSEVQHGERCLAQSWHDEKVGGKLRETLSKLDPGLVKVITENFDSRAIDREDFSYLISISEHGDDKLNEDKYGRLSMWRAYGGSTNVAMVFNNFPFVNESTALNAYTSPVLYCDEEEFKIHFASMAAGLEQNLELLKTAGAEIVGHALFMAFHFAALSTKHPGFSEEREWRVIHSPTLLPSNKLTFDTETIDGVPQRVCKLELKNYPDEGFTGATLPELLEEIIIGPTQYPWPIQDALARKLEEKQVKDPWSKVRVSSIPLRR